MRAIAYLTLMTCARMWLLRGMVMTVRKTNLGRRMMMAVASAGNQPGTSELVAYRGSNGDIISALKLLSSKRGADIYSNTHTTQADDDEVTWSMHCDKLQVDCTMLEPMFLGKQKLSIAETAQKWDEALSLRTELLNTYARLSPTSSSSTSPSPSPPSSSTPLPTTLLNLGDGGKLQAELNAALAAVQKASFMSRSMQRHLLRGAGSVNKGDKSPVTIADFAVQTLVIYTLSQAFPADRFIAEEDSELLRGDASIRAGVLEALRAAANHVVWTDDLLYSTLDKGTFDGTAPRVWVLDPVDGTKGFMRGEHYCIALALLINGKASLGVLGCPNLHLKNVLEPTVNDSTTGSTDMQALTYVGETVDFPALHGEEPAQRVGASPASEGRRVAHSPGSGSIFFAVQGRGAFARSLSMPLGAAFEVQVSGCPEAGAAAMCESAEAAHGDRATTQRVFKTLNLRRGFVRLDGQCKHGVVGAGAAEINIRLPPPGYREKIWDHAAGEVFITEAGGTVTDLQGRGLDFTQGRLLDASVTGILSSNGLLHEEFLRTIVESRRIEAEEIAQGRKVARPRSMNE